MAATAMKDFRGVIWQLAQRDGGALSDGALLRAYAVERDEAALGALVKRHSSMVWNVCRRVLGDGHDAEDAFQAVFLVLVRKAAGVREPEKIGNWLYGVAQQTAVRVRGLRTKRGLRERQVEAMPEPATAEQHWHDLTPILDNELGRLPDQYRTLIVLCDLEERPRSEVARHLGCPEGTVAGRLARARALLAERLTRRGVTTTAGSVAAAFGAQPASAVPNALVELTLQTVFTGGMPATVIEIANGVTQAMFLNKLKLTIAALTALAVCVTGSVLVFSAGPTPQPPAKDANSPARSSKETPPRDVKVAPAKFSMTATAPKFQRPDPVDLPDFTFWETTLTFKNESKEEIVLSPFVKLNVLDAAGKTVESDVFIGAGFAAEDMMERIEKQFLVIAPGKTASVAVNLGNHDMGNILTGWHFKRPGAYTIELAYEFNKKTFLTDFGRFFFSEEAAEKSNLPERKWNRAIEGKQAVQIKLTVAK